MIIRVILEKIRAYAFFDFVQLTLNSWPVPSCDMLQGQTNDSCKCFQTYNQIVFSDSHTLNQEMDHSQSDFLKKNLLQHGKSEHKMCDMLLDKEQSKSWTANIYIHTQKVSVELDKALCNIVIVIFTYMLAHESALSTMCI